MMSKKNYISSISGYLVVVCYLTFTVLAYTHYRMAYSPVTNWLSDLGNLILNPHGFYFYNIGIIATALLLALFFIGLSIWKLNNSRIQNIMLLLMQGFGLLGSLSMIMSAIFPINVFDMHSFWSKSLYIMLGTAFVFSVAAFRYHRKVPIWLLILGLSIAFIVILTSVFPTLYLLEWITVLLFLGYVGLISFFSMRMNADETPVFQ
jgi:hypothetical membrane protein